MNQTPESTTPAPAPEPVPFPRLSRWLDMLDEALEIGTRRTPEH